jgi:hypothetical protein
MFKRLIVASLLMLGIIAVNRVDVDAHLAGYIYDGTWQHIASYNCVGSFKQVPQKAPALFECVGVISELQYVCANSQGVETEGNNVRTDITVLAGTSFGALDIKQNGTATATVKMPQTALEFADLQCKTRNRLWHATRELVLKVDVSLKTFDLVCANKGPCTNPTVKVAASESWVHCGRPFDANGNFFDLVTNPPPGNGVATPYPCFVVQEVHCDKESGCPIDVDPSQFASRNQPYNLNAGIHSLLNRAWKPYGRL